MRTLSPTSRGVVWTRWVLDAHPSTRVRILCPATRHTRAHSDRRKRRTGAPPRRFGPILVAHTHRGRHTDPRTTARRLPARLERSSQPTTARRGVRTGLARLRSAPSDADAGAMLTSDRPSCRCGRQLLYDEVSWSNGTAANEIVITQTTGVSAHCTSERLRALHAYGCSSAEGSRAVTEHDTRGEHSGERAAPSVSEYDYDLWNGGRPTGVHRSIDLHAARVSLKSERQAGTDAPWGRVRCTPWWW